MSQIAKALAELDSQTQGKNSGKPGEPSPNLDRLFKRVNRYMGLSRFKPGHSRYVTKEKFIEILVRLNTGRHICPEGATYSLERLRRIIRNFANKEDYKIPRRIYRKATWFQEPLLDQLRNPQSYEKFTAQMRLKHLDQDQTRKAIYTASRVSDTCHLID